MANDIFSQIAMRAKARAGLLSPQELQAMQEEAAASPYPSSYPIPLKGGSAYGGSVTPGRHPDGTPFQENEERRIDLDRRGYADLSFENLGRLASNWGLMGPGVIQTGIQSLAELAVGQPGSGIYGGVQNFEGN